jgi:cadmium resistance protein CadD (predicted permease)
MSEPKNDLTIVIRNIVGALGIIAAVFFVSLLLAVVLREMVIVLAGVIVAAIGIFYLIRSINHHDESLRAKRPPDPL